MVGPYVRAWSRRHYNSPENPFRPICFIFDGTFPFAILASRRIPPRLQHSTAHSTRHTAHTHSHTKQVKFIALKKTTTDLRGKTATTHRHSTTQTHSTQWCWYGGVVVVESERERTRHSLQRARWDGWNTRASATLTKQAQKFCYITQEKRNKNVFRHMKIWWGGRARTARQDNNKSNVEHPPYKTKKGSAVVCVWCVCLRNGKRCVVKRENVSLNKFPFYVITW